MKTYWMGIIVVLWCHFNGVVFSTQVILDYVIDGDTLQVWDQNESKTVRLIGIDCAETRPSIQLDRQVRRWKQSPSALVEWGKRAKENVIIRLNNQPYLTLQFDTVKQDRYGRVLAYVFLPDNTFLNEWLLNQQLAHVWAIPPNIHYQERLALAWIRREGPKRRL